MNAIGDACRMREWDKAWCLQQELDAAVMEIGDAIVAGLNGGR